MRYARDMHCVRDMSFGRDMRYARLRLQEKIEYHCAPSGVISLLRSKNITPSRARHITFVVFVLTNAVLVKKG